MEMNFARLQLNAQQLFYNWASFENTIASMQTLGAVTAIELSSECERGLYSRQPRAGGKGLYTF